MIVVTLCTEAMSFLGLFFAIAFSVLYNCHPPIVTAKSTHIQASLVENKESDSNPWSSVSASTSGQETETTLHRWC